MLASSQTQNVANQLGMPKWYAALLRETRDLVLSVRRRWRLHRMQSLDDHMLDDIGVTRDELQWAIGLPFRVNAALALHERARRRRLAERQCSHLGQSIQ